MAIYEEVAVRRVLVLADARFEQGGTLHLRESAAQIGAHLLHASLPHQAIVVFRVDGSTVPIGGNLNTAVFDIRQAVHLILMVQPDRHGGRLVFERTRWRPEEEHLLPCWKDSIAQHRWKHRRQPRSARKYKSACRYLVAGTRVK